MARSDLLALVRHVGGGSGEPDADLLGRFVDTRDPAAFAELVRRYARLVWGQCRNLLSNEADADDAFQATFLALAKSARSIRDTDRLGPWLHAVAYKVCLNARRAATRRTKRERSTAVREASRPVADSAWDAASAAVHEEVSRLPDTLRVPFVLCHLEGKAPTAAAEQLGLPWGTFSSRLSRAKQRLLDRLSARGIGAAVVLAAVGGGVSASAVVVDRAIGYCSNPASVPASVLSLGSGVGVMSRAKLLAVVLLASVGAALFVPGGGSPAVPAAHAAPVPKGEEAKKKELEAAWADLASSDDLVASRALLRLRDGGAVALFAKKLKPLTLTEERAKELLAELGSDDEKTWRAAYEELSYLDPRLVMSVTDVVKESKGRVHDERLAAILHCRPPGEAEAFKWCKIGLRVNPAAPRPGTPVPASLQVTNHPNKPADFQTILDKENVPQGVSFAVATDPKALGTGHIQHPSWRRAVRAVALLEHVGTPDAVKVIEQMASGHGETTPTVAAKEALERLKK